MTIFTLLSETDHYTIITIIKFRKLNMNIVILSVFPNGSRGKVSTCNAGDTA